MQRLHGVHRCSVSRPLRYSAGPLAARRSVSRALGLRVFRRRLPAVALLLKPSAHRFALLGIEPAVTVKVEAAHQVCAAHFAFTPAFFEESLRFRALFLIELTVAVLVKLLKNPSGRGFPMSSLGIAP